MCRCPYIHTFYSGRYPSELAELVPLPYCRYRDTSYFDRLYDFFVTIPKCYVEIFVTVTFHAQLETRCLHNTFF